MILYGEDIYFTHQHPEYGNELFYIDYNTVAKTEIEILSPLKITPNPTRDYINVEHNSILTPISTSIIDMRGNTVMNPIITNNIDVGHLSIGIYIVKTIYKNGKVGIQKFIVN